MTNNILFGIILTLVVFIAARYLSKTTGSTLLNPLLISSIVVILILLALNIPYENYNKGGAFFTYLIGPATVSLAIPLYKNLDTLKKNTKIILVGVLSAILIHFVVIAILAIVLNVDPEITYSMIPKSITTAFAKDVSVNLGGIEIITIAVVIVTGIFGAAMSETINKLLKVDDDIAIGMALGSSAHAIGTSKAVENNEIQATFSSLALILTGIMTVLLSPLFAALIKFII